MGICRNNKGKVMLTWKKCISYITDVDVVEVREGMTLGLEVGLTRTEVEMDSQRLHDLLTTDREDERELGALVFDIYVRINYILIHM